MEAEEPPFESHPHLSDHCNVTVESMTITRVVLGNDVSGFPLSGCGGDNHDISLATSHRARSGGGLGLDT